MHEVKIQHARTIFRRGNGPISRSKQTACRLAGLKPFARRAHGSLRAQQSDADSADEEPIDIDALARKLSQEADRLRRSESGKEASTSEPASQNNAPSEPAGLEYTLDDPIFGAKVRLQADLNGCSMIIISALKESPLVNVSEGDRPWQKAYLCISAYSFLWPW